LIAAVAIALATAAIKDQNYFRQRTEEVKRARESLIGQLRDLKLKVPESHANFVLAETGNCPASEIFDELVRRNIFVRYFDLPSLADKLRITVGTTEQNEKLILALKEILP